jgi:putative membrane protein
MNSKTRKIAGYVLSGLVTFVFVATGAMKFTGGEQNVQMAELVGGASTLHILGGLQIFFALLFLDSSYCCGRLFAYGLLYGRSYGYSFGYQRILCLTDRH